MNAAVVRVNGASAAEVQDAIAVEEPLEVRLGTVPFAVLMRTPGDDTELVAGFSSRSASSDRSRTSAPSNRAGTWITPTPGR